MPRLALLQERLTVPQEAATFNRSSPWARGLRALVTPFGEAVTGTHATPAAGATAVAPSPIGSTWRFVGSSAVEVARVPYVPPPLTLLVVARKSNTPNESLVSFGGAGPGAGWKFCDDSLPANAAVVYGGVAQYNGPPDYFLIGTEAVYVVTLSATLASFYRNGELIGTASVGTPNTPTRPLTIGASHNGSFVDFATSDIAVVGLWNFVATAEQVRQLSSSIPQLWEGEPIYGPFVGSLSGPSGPTINTQPSNQSVTAPATATFSVTATTSGGSLTYQWRRNGTNISGANSASYTTPATSVSGGSANNGDLYSVVVTDSNGSTTSSNATLTVAPAPLAVTLNALVDESGSPRASYTVDKIWAIRASDNTLVATWTNQTTNGSGVLPALSHVALTAVPHVFVTWDDNETPNNAGAKTYTPA